MGMFDKYRILCSPDNRFKFVDTDETDEIVIGGTILHTFELPFKWEGYIKSGEVIYKQGDHIIQPTLQILDAWVHSGNGYSVICVPLSPDYTKKFSFTTLNTTCQLKLTTENNEVYYDDPKVLRVLLPLDQKGYIKNEE